MLGSSPTGSSKLSPHRLWVRIVGFHPAGQGSSPCAETKNERRELEDEGQEEKPSG